MIRVPTWFLDARRNPSVRRRLLGLLVLEGYCRARCYCWVGNAEFAAMLGYSDTSAADLLKELEEAGDIRRVPTSQGRRGRLGIILFRRADPDLPVCGREPEEIAAVIEQMTETRAARRDKARGQSRFPFRDTSPKADESDLTPSPACDAPGDPGAIPPVSRGHHDPENPGPELRRLPERDEPEDDDKRADPPPGDSPGIGSRRRLSTETDPPASPAVPELQALIAKAGAWLRSDATGRVAEASRNYPVDWIDRALDLAGRKAKETSWGFVLGVLRNWKAEGGPSVPAVRRAAPVPNVMPRQDPVPPDDTPPTPEEVASLLERAAGRGVAADWARRILARIGVEARPQRAVDDGDICFL